MIIMKINKKFRQKVEKIIELLDEFYPDTKCFLDYETPWQLLVATILSAQCTDQRVNIVTKDLFARYTHINELAAADVAELEEIIKSTGLYHSKAKNIIAAAKLIQSDYGGEVPSGLEALTKLPGVGRKTANIVRGHIFGIPSIAVDTHVKRVSFRLGLTKNTDPDKVELDLMDVLPEHYWIKYNNRIIAHGRAVCKARSPSCGGCCLNMLCLRKM